MKSNQSHEISSSCSFLREDGETHQEGLGSCLPRSFVAFSSSLCPAQTPVEGIRPGAAPGDPLERTAHRVSVWCLILSLQLLCALSCFPTPSEVGKEQLQEATNTARINSAFHSSRHARKVMLQGSHCCTAPAQDLQTK